MPGCAWLPATAEEAWARVPPVQEGLEHTNNSGGLAGQPGCRQGPAAELGGRHVDDVCHGQHGGQLLGAGGHLQDQLRLWQGTRVSNAGPVCGLPGCLYGIPVEETGQYWREQQAPASLGWSLAFGLASVAS